MDGFRHVVTRGADTFEQSVPTLHHGIARRSWRGERLVGLHVTADVVNQDEVRERATDVESESVAGPLRHSNVTTTFAKASISTRVSGPITAVESMSSTIAGPVNVAPAESFDRS